MLKKILIANRGEIALRIIRTAKEMGIKTVAVYSKADKDSLHTRMADEKICIGEAPSQKSYLFYQNILGAAEATGADAIHPGYGFLAENADFAAACNALDIIFIGPDPKSMQQMGDKAKAKKIIKKAKVPTIPGSDGIVDDLDTAKKIAAKIGYPVILKASAGGGGKGMRIVKEENDLQNNLKNAAQEAEKAFNSPDLYIEKFIPNAKHIEIQIMSDNFGNTLHLYERECTIQRQHQKLIEESPCPFLSEKLRKNICENAIKAAKNVNYHSAGTVEFLFDIDNDKFYFMEMNTRIQVEHPVTETITDLDIVKMQIAVAGGEKIKLKQHNIKHKGHAIECRINAEDWKNKFRASPGEIKNFIPPGGFGIRVDSACYSGCNIFPYYDSLIAKLIAWGNTRKEAINRMKRALAEFIIEGIHTTIGFHQKVLDHPDFINLNFTTNFINLYF